MRVRDEMRRELRRLGARAESRGPAAAGDSGMQPYSRSASSSKIAGLVTDRLTNREIATSLFLSAAPDRVAAAETRVSEAGAKVSAGMKRIMELAKKANSVMGESGQVGLDLDQHKISELKPIFDEMWKEAKTEAMNIKSFVSSVLDLLGR